ncbi:MAG: EutN/CcmL family microcompartment protein [Clostridiaceae bacterium]|jgi:ethanolamine utilization protein EutN|nr:EutN/CcmL family microcompartment protein [Clostridiaceae bacterium]
MILARVIGNLVATQKNENLVGKKLLLIQPIDLKGRPDGDELLAVDAVGSGEGDLVIAIAEGGSARQVSKTPSLAPVDIAIAGIVDEVVSTEDTLRLYD